jgi:hypothetical protein
LVSEDWYFSPISLNDESMRDNCALLVALRQVY